MAFADSNTKFPLLVSLIDAAKATIGQITTAANAFVLTAGQTAAGAGRSVAIAGGAATGTNLDGGSVAIQAGAANGTGINGTIALTGTTSWTPVGAAPGALPVNPLASVIEIESAGNFTLPTPAAALAGSVYEVVNPIAGNAVFTTISGVTSVTLGQFDALRVYCDGAAWYLLSTTGTVV